MANDKELLYEAKREWKQLVLETNLRAYREEYGDEELNELFGALKKAGSAALDQVKGMFGFETKKQKKAREEKEKEDKAKDIYRNREGGDGTLKGFGAEGYKGKKGKVKTWGQLKDVLEIANNLHQLDDIKAKANAAGAGARTALGFLITFINPAVGSTLKAIETGVSYFANAKNSKDMAMTMRNANDEVLEDAPLLDIFKIDDGYQRIVDDGMERQFLSWFGNWIEKKMKNDPEGEVPAMDINKIFEEFLAHPKSGEGVETLKDADSDTKLTEIPYNGTPEEVGSAWDKVKAAAEGLIDEFL